VAGRASRVLPDIPIFEKSAHPLNKKNDQSGKTQTGKSASFGKDLILICSQIFQPEFTH